MNIIEAYEKGSFIKRPGDLYSTCTAADGVNFSSQDITATDWEVITPRPPKRIKRSRTVWVNCYSDWTDVPYRTKAYADRAAGRDRVACDAR